jgi:hypothetical protein
MPARTPPMKLAHERGLEDAPVLVERRQRVVQVAHRIVPNSKLHGAAVLLEGNAQGTRVTYAPLSKREEER